MWLRILSCFLVGFAYASQQPQWNENTEYIYQVRGRSLTSLSEISNNYVGVILKAQLSIVPNSDGNLIAQISQFQYASISATLEGGCAEYIPDSELAYRELEFSTEPFQISMKDGAIVDIIVSNNIKNWEANVIKSIVSQFQLDTNAKNLIRSHINIRTDTNGVYKTMEETVTGRHETLYEIHPLPEYILQTEPWLVPLKHLQKNGDVIEIVKTKNFTASMNRPYYHFGFDGIKDFNLNNKIGEFFTRISIDRAVITGTLNRFAIQSSVTLDQIYMSPTLGNKQRGSVSTIVNVTLLSIQQQSQQNPEIPNPVAVGLVYKYNSPFSNSNEPRPGEQPSHQYFADSLEGSDFDSREQFGSSQKSKLEFLFNRRPSSSSSDSDSSISDEGKRWQQNRPTIHQAPESPLLPFTVGFDGQSITKTQNVVENARKLAQLIAREFAQPETIPQKNTLGKFVMLTSLLRVMDHDNMMKFASQMYTQQESAEWKVARDSIAEAGTGPALLVIQEWIKTNKFEAEEASEIICTAAEAARQPTEEYMETFYKVIQSDEVISQPGLNESALLCYTNLVYKVYVNQDYSHAKYPVHSFGTFNSEKGRNFVKTRLIPDLSRNLNEAIANDDTQNIHLYIRGLGNVGHRRILEAFEPYLEGQKQASQFQRLLMVVALDKLVENNPTVARSVLFKIYQNSNEDEQVRVAAVYQLIRTSPPPSMLQRMASHTNVDPNEYVNSAVKSSIESAAESEEPEYSRLRLAALSAKHLLTPQQYGVEYSSMKLRSFVVEQLQQSYRQRVEVFGGYDSFLPKGLKYNLRGRFSGVKRQVINMQAIVSSLDDLTMVLRQQTQKYQKQQRQKQAANSVKYKLSSEYIAKYLKMENEQRERLEGNLYFQMGDLEKILSFDNQTIENLPEVVRQLEEQLSNGKPFRYTKMLIQNEAALFFPTALGVPFLYTYDRPTLVRLEGNIKAKAEPKISHKDRLSKPDSISAGFEINALISGKTQGRFGFISPCDSQIYVAGYDKNFQVRVPLSGNGQADLENAQLQVELENPDRNKDINLLHYSTIPYTAQNDIYNHKPDQYIIKKKHPQQINTIFGIKSTGIAFKVQMSSEQPIDSVFVYEKLRQHDLISAMLGPWLDENIQFTEINVGVDARKSTTEKVTIQVGSQHVYDERKKKPNKRVVDISKLDKIPDEPLRKQKEFIKLVSEDISVASSCVVDATIKFSGLKEITYGATVAGSKSKVDPQGNLLVQLRKQDNQSQPQKFYLAAKQHFPITNGLNVDNVMRMDPTSNITIQAAFGESVSKSAKIAVDFEFSKSEERTQYLREQPEYVKCQRQMQEGNHILPACAKMIVQANLLDRVEGSIVYPDFDPKVVNQTYKLYSMLRQLVYPKLEENFGSFDSMHNHLDIQAKFEPDLQAVNFSVSGPYARIQGRNIEVAEWLRSILVPHPVFDIKSRMIGHLLKYDTYRPLCVVDQDAVNTFDNKTYPLTLGQDWTVQLQYVPRTPSSIRNQPQQQTVAAQLNEQTEGYVVLVRAWPQDSSQKEVKAVVQSPSTHGNIVAINLKPGGSSQYPRLFINNEEIKYDDKIGSTVYGDYLQVYPLPNNEIRVEIYEAFNMIYDGVRVQVAAVNSKFKDASRGLCGTFTNEEETDFLSPGNCILKTSEEFVSSYTLSEGQKMSLSSSDQEGECYQKKVVNVDVISLKDIGRESNVHSCIMHQTQYVDRGNEICFTLRPLPVCKTTCQQKGSVSKKIPVHCAEPTAATNLWRSEIDKGNSPDFSMKPQTRKITVKMPMKCLP